MSTLNVPLIDEIWLKDAGFKWHQHDRQPGKHWLLWLGAANNDRLVSFEDLGLELAWCSEEDGWYCWLRSDTAGRYHRFIHIRRVKTQADVIHLVEALTGKAWMPEDHFYGHVYLPKDAERIRKEHQRLDHQIREQCAKWSEIEKDDTRGRALPDHVENARVFEKSSIAKP